MLTLLVLAGLNSCRIKEDLLADDIGNQSDSIMTVTAVLEPPVSDTRTLLSGGVSVVWKSGDKIRIFNSSNPSGAVFTLDSKSDGASTGTFTGYISGTGPYYAVYPSTAPTSFSGTQISLSIPAVQNYSSGSFASGANISVSTATTLNNFSFKNVCGVLCLQLTGDKSIKKIVVTSKSVEYLNGSAKVDMSYPLSGAPSMAMTEESESDLYRSITLDCGSVQLSSTSQPFYFVVPVGTLSSGFMVEIVDSGDYSMFKSAKASSKNQIIRSKIVSMPSFAYGREYNSAVQSQDYGFYSSAGASSSSPTVVYKYEEGSQIGFTTADKCTFRLQNWDKEYAVTFSNIPANPALDGTFFLYLKRMDKYIYDLKYLYYEVRVIRKIDNTVWLVDEDNNCFILYIE